MDKIIEITEKNLEKTINSLLKERPSDSYKNIFGTLSIYAGSERFRGCAILACLAAHRSGCGLTRLCSTEKVIASVCSALPCTTFFPLNEKNGHISVADSDLVASLDRADALLIGCGMTKNDDTQALVEKLFISSLPAVLDADGLNSICGKKSILKRDAPTIVTPHIGEMARLAGAPASDVAENMEDYAIEMSEAYGVITVLKSHKTVVTNGEDTYVVNIPNSGMSKGGSGDVLAGIIGSLLAQRYEPLEAALLGVLLHCDAGIAAADKKGVIAMLPSDLIDEL